MAILSQAEAIQLIKEPKNIKELREAKRKRQRHNLHTEADVEISHLAFSEKHTLFLNWVRDVLKSSDNFDRFQQLYRPPVPTNELVESIFSKFEKVFESHNAFEKFEFKNEKLEQDFIQYRHNIGDFQFWETQGFETFKTSIDNILVIDLPKSQRSDRPEPYYYVLDLDNVIDIKNTKVKGLGKDGDTFYYFKTEYIIFKGEGNLVYVFDDTAYRTFLKVDDQTITLAEDGEVLHKLGYCPARSFWTTPLNSSTTILKRGPVTNSLSDLDWLLFFTISERYLQLYAPFPIYAVYKSKCTYKDPFNAKRICVDGLLETEGQRSLNKTPCPQCANKVKTGPGNVIFIDPPKGDDQPDLMSNPIKVIPAETTSLEFVQGAIEALRKQIVLNCVGRSQDPNNDQAQNEMQVADGQESKESVLLKVKRNFEIIHEFALETVAKLRYGSDFLAGTINYGDKFFGADESAEVTTYEQAVKSGLPEYELSLRRDAINNARYRNDPKALERLNILKNLMPFPDYSVEKLQSIRTQMPEAVDIKAISLKLNFNNLIDRFERMNGNLLTFASALTFDKKINAIQDGLYLLLDNKVETDVAEDIVTDDVPGSDVIDTPTDIEAEAKARLKGSVGGVQGILSIQAAVASGASDYDAAIAVLGEIFGFDEVKAEAMLGPRVKKTVTI